MWVYTKHGFFSVVQSKKPETLIVRARCSEDMAMLLLDLHDLGLRKPPVKKIPKADYRYRVELHRSDYVLLLAKWTNELDYTNFKDAVHGDPARDRAYLECWLAMAEFQERKALHN